VSAGSERLINGSACRDAKAMSSHDVTVFRPYEFVVGERITIDQGPRGGDWEVVGVSERKVRLRCPIRGREVEWARCCYLIDKRTGVSWPSRV